MRMYIDDWKKANVIDGEGLDVKLIALDMDGTLLNEHGVLAEESKEALLKAHREDLIGSGPKCLIRAIPPKPGGYVAKPSGKGKPSMKRQTNSRKSAPRPASKGNKPAKKR